MAHDSIATEPGGTRSGDIVAGDRTAGGQGWASKAGGSEGGYATSWWERQLEEERSGRASDRKAHEARVTELLDENNKLLQRARDAEAQALRWFNMSKDLLAVAGEFAKLLAKP